MAGVPGHLKSNKMKTDLDFAQVEKFKEDLDRCTKCGFCMSSCPVYQEEHVESSVARGKIMLIRALLDGDLTLTDEMAEQLNKCTLCLTCAQNCPAGTPGAGGDYRRPGG